MKTDWFCNQLLSLGIFLHSSISILSRVVIPNKQSAVSVDAKNKLLDEIALLLGKGANAQLKINTNTNGDSALTGKELIWACKLAKGP